MKRTWYDGCEGQGLASHRTKKQTNKKEGQVSNIVFEKDKVTKMARGTEV
jgi:hypothetical protein